MSLLAWRHGMLSGERLEEEALGGERCSWCVRHGGAMRCWGVVDQVIRDLQFAMNHSKQATRNIWVRSRPAGTAEVAEQETSAARDGTKHGKLA